MTTTSEYTKTFTRFAWLQRKAKCAHRCEDSTIESYNPVVKVTIFKDGKRFGFVYHPHCYLAQGIAYLELHPPIVRRRGPGRTKMHLDVKDIKARRRLIVQAAYLRRKRVEAVGKQWWWMLDIIDTKFEVLKDKFKKVGGVPSHWR